MGNKIRVLVEQNGKEVLAGEFTSFPVVFGRDVRCDLPLRGFGFLSRLHGAIFVENSEIIVSDQSSRNGIMHEGRKLKAFIGRGACEFNIGDLVFKVTLANA